MTLQCNGTTGVDIIQDGAVQTADIAPLAVTAPKLSGGQSGSAPVYGARAWCVFDGTLTGTNAPLAGGNVTNVTRVSVGFYTINFTSPMVDTNYATVSSGTIVGTSVSTQASLAVAQTISAVSVTSFAPSTGAALDAKQFSVAVFR